MNRHRPLRLLRPRSIMAFPWQTRTANLRHSQVSEANPRQFLPVATSDLSNFPLTWRSRHTCTHESHCTHTPQQNTINLDVGDVIDITLSILFMNETVPYTFFAYLRDRHGFTYCIIASR